MDSVDLCSLWCCSARGDSGITQVRPVEGSGRLPGRSDVQLPKGMAKIVKLLRPFMILTNPSSSAFVPHDSLDWLALAATNARKPG